MPVLPEVFQKTDYLTIFEIAETHVTIIARRPEEEVCLYVGLIVKLKHKQEIRLFETEPVFASALDAANAMLRIREEAQKFVEHEQKV